MSTAKDTTPELLERTLAQLSMRDLLITAPLNPLLVELSPPFFAPEGLNCWSWPGQASSIMTMPWSKAPDAFKREEASWHFMLVRQPPAQTITITETCHGMDGDFEHRAVLNDLSLRMGILYLTVPFIDVSHHRSSYCAAISGGNTLDKRFYSDGRKLIKVNFGESTLRVHAPPPLALPASSAPVSSN
ncbi:hypothetical protein C8R44DRAFT_875731 [Mycena epipterygia]|nr:hypothetical protein C8R44DRAFT_875731 [Mycena epipterygia]